jgi:hypothetical protein
MRGSYGSHYSANRVLDTRQYYDNRSGLLFNCRKQEFRSAGGTSFHLHPADTTSDNWPRYLVVHFCSVGAFARKDRANSNNYLLIPSVLGSSNVMIETKLEILQLRRASASLRQDDRLFNGTQKQLGDSAVLIQDH